MCRALKDKSEWQQQLVPLNLQFKITTVDINYLIVQIHDWHKMIKHIGEALLLTLSRLQPNLY